MLGKALLEWRKSKKLSQSEIATTLGITREYLGKIERCQAEPGRALENQISQLIENKEKPNLASFTTLTPPFLDDDLPQFKAFLNALHVWITEKTIACATALKRMVDLRKKAALTASEKRELESEEKVLAEYQDIQLWTRLYEILKKRFDDRLDIIEEVIKNTDFSKAKTGKSG
jgi:transcriptional regulator with XRE-family HTH domain